MNVYILESRNLWVESEWRLVSIYQTPESAQRAMSAMSKVNWNPKHGYELRTVERMVHP